MTAKEKAIQLVDNYRMLLMNEDTDCGNEILCTMIAKQCALIAVDEITTALTISTGHLLINKLDENELVKDFNHWNEVKTEIEKL